MPNAVFLSIIEHSSSILGRTLTTVGPMGPKLEIPLEFLHADELEKRYSLKDIPLPAVLRNMLSSLRF
jgi:hypothetical protein